jgi:hypothetical protein
MGENNTIPKDILDVNSSEWKIINKYCSEDNWVKIKNKCCV